MIKYSSETYLKDVLEHSLKIFVDNKLSYYIVIKKIIKIKAPFLLKEYGQYITILNNNYFILEYIPKDKNYICRVFIDNEWNVIEKIFLFTKENNIFNGIPTYDDLKICQIFIDNKWKLYNKDVFDKLYSQKEINKTIYKKIMNQINNVKEAKLPFDYKDYLY